MQAEFLWIAVLNRCARGHKMIQRFCNDRVEQLWPRWCGLKDLEYLLSFPQTPCPGPLHAHTHGHTHKPVHEHSPKFIEHWPLLPFEGIGITFCHLFLTSHSCLTLTLFTPPKLHFPRSWKSLLLAKFKGHLKILTSFSFFFFFALFAIIDHYRHFENFPFISLTDTSLLPWSSPPSGNSFAD